MQTATSEAEIHTGAVALHEHVRFGEAADGQRLAITEATHPERGPQRSAVAFLLLHGFA